MIRPFHIVLFFLWINNSIAQQETDTVPQPDLAGIAHINQSDSDITFPTVIVNLEPLMWDANINSNFIIRNKADSRFMMLQRKLKKILNR